MIQVRKIGELCLNHKAGCFVFFLIVVGSVLRLWNLQNTMMFLGDQGRDALVVADIFRERDLAFIGPVTSVGNMYLGPAYYYFMLPWLWLSYPSPVGPAYAVAILGIITIYVMFKAGQEMLGTRAGVIAATLMTFSWTTIYYSRFSWNPNPEPLVSTLFIWFLYRAWCYKKPWFYALATIMMAILLQLHYVTLLFAPILAGVIGLDIRRSKTRKRLVQYLLWTGSSIALVIISLLPLLLFDWKHNWLNAHAFLEMFVGSESFGAAEESLVSRMLSTLQETHGRSMHLFFELWLPERRMVNTLGVILAGLSTAYLFFRPSKKHRFSERLIIGILIVSILGLSAYSNSVFDHYILFLLPVVYLFFAQVLSRLLSVRIIGPLFVFLALLVFIIQNASQYSFGTSGLNITFIQKTTQEITKIIPQNSPYALVLLSASRDLYGMNYRYFLSTYPGYRPVNPEYTNTAKYLIVIDEEKLVENPLEQPIYELITFRDGALLVDTYQLEHGPVVYVLQRDVAE